MNYFKEIDTMLEKYFAVFQQTIIQFDDQIYRSDKAYPVLTAPMKLRLSSSTHSLESFGQYVSKLSQEWEYLQELV